MRELGFIKNIFFWICCAYICILTCCINSENKTLVIILAETRASEITYENIKANLIDQLQADLAVCIGKKANTFTHDSEEKFVKNARYKFFFDEPEDFALAFDYAAEQIQKKYSLDGNRIRPWRDYLKIKDQFMGGIKDPSDEHPGSAGILIFFRWFLLKNLIEEGLIDRYEYFVITRSDYLFRMPHPPAEVISSNKILIPNGEQYGGLTDRHVVLPAQCVEKYLNILEKMIIKDNLYYEKMHTKNEWNLEKLILFHLEQESVLKNVFYFPYIMYSIRPIGGSTRWSSGVFFSNLNYYVKYLSEFDTSLKNFEEFSRIKQEMKNYSIKDYYNNNIKKFSEF